MTSRTQRFVFAAASLAAFIGLSVASPLRATAQDAQAPLNAQEQAIVDYIDAHFEESVDLLQRLVDINSGTLNEEGVRRVADVLEAELQPLGMETRWIELPESTRRAGHLFAETPNGTGPGILLIGHLDTVFEEDSPFQRFVRSGDTATGPGVVDMKGGDVVIVYALKALAAAGALEDAKLTVAFIGDEEKPGRPLELVRRDLIEAAIRSDIALGFEGGMRDEQGEYGTVARRSSSEWRLRTWGQSSHSSGVFSEAVGSGAIFEAARILKAFHEELRGEEYLTFNPGVIVGGTDVEYDADAARGTAFGKTNVVAGEVVVHGGIRTISDAQLDSARTRMREIASRSLPQTGAEIVFADGYPAMSPTAGNRALLAKLNEINRDLGMEPLMELDPGRRGAADISFAAPFVDALAALGPYGSGSHSTDETIDLASMPKVMKRAALLIYRLTR